MDIFDKIYDSELTRDENNLYTLGDSRLDMTFNLKQQSPVFTPNKKHIEDFAAISYLFSILGFTPFNFTATTMGYIACYNNGEESKTIMIDNGPITKIYRQKIKTLIDEKLKGNNLNKDERFILEQTSVLMENDNMDMIDICLFINSLGADKIFNVNIEKTMFEFSPDKRSLNSKNCDNNHEILRVICCEVLGYDPDSMNKEQSAEVEELYKDILNNWILPGYLTYKGKDRSGKSIYHDTDSLTNLNRLNELFSKVKSKEHLVKILNMCATDYTADIVYDVLCIINNCKDVQVSKESINDTISDSLYIDGRKSMARSYIDHKNNNLPRGR